MIIRSFLAVGLALAVAAAFPSVGRAAVTGHLYVATRFSKAPALERYALIDGIPAARPDFRIRGKFTISTVGFDGTIYAANRGSIDVFPPNARRPARVIDFPKLRSQCGGTSEFESFAVDPFGYLFVAYINYYPTLRGRLGRGSGSPTFPCSGVATFAPSANGHALPVTTISISSADLTGLAVGVSPDASERLFVADTDYARVLEYANPARVPRLVTTLQTGISYPTGLATDPIGNLYELDGYGCGSAAINVFGPNSGPQTPPLRSITFAFGYRYTQGIAYRDGYVYTYQACSTPQLMQLYDPTASGLTIPLYETDLENAVGFSLGP